MNPLLQVNFRPPEDLNEWFRAEAKRLRIPLTEALTAAIEHWRATIEANGDAQWLPGYVKPAPQSEHES